MCAKINSLYLTVELTMRQNDAPMTSEFNMPISERSRTIPDDAITASPP